MLTCCDSELVMGTIAFRIQAVKWVSDTRLANVRNRGVEEDGG